MGKMAKSIHASLFHCASSDANPYHIPSITQLEAIAGVVTNKTKPI